MVATKALKSIRVEYTGQRFLIYLHPFLLLVLELRDKLRSRKKVVDWTGSCWLTKAFIFCFPSNSNLEVSKGQIFTKLETDTFVVRHVFREVQKFPWDLVSLWYHVSVSLSSSRDKKKKALNCKCRKTRIWTLKLHACLF